MKKRELLGYFEEFLLHREGCSPKGIGAKIYPVELPPDQQGRGLGSTGERTFTLTEPFTLKSNLGELKCYKASLTKPMTVTTYLNPLEGKEMNNETAQWNTEAGGDFV